MKGGSAKVEIFGSDKWDPCQKKTSKKAFLAVAPFIVKFRFEKLTNEKEARWILNQWEPRVSNIFIWNNEISKKMGAVEIILQNFPNTAF